MQPTDPLRHVEHWVFDLDNTLYPARSNLFAQIDQRMGEYIRSHYDLPEAEAKALQKRLFRDYGTTLRGLMNERAVDPGPFLEFVHDIDISAIGPSPTLAAALADLPGRKIVFTNGSVRHAERVLGRLGVVSQFDGIFDIVAADYVPKPDPGPSVRERGSRTRRGNPASGALFLVIIIGTLGWYVIKRLRRR